jgi:hypothetical protein
MANPAGNQPGVDDKNTDALSKLRLLFGDQPPRRTRDHGQILLSGHAQK